jgi:hypothetical protein
MFLLEMIYGYVKLFFKLCKNKKTARRVQSSFWGARCGFKKGQAKAVVDKGHSRLAPGRALHPPWEYFLIVG